MSQGAIENYWMLEVNLNETEENSEFMFQIQESCGTCLQIDAAIAFDSKFCKLISGIDDATRRAQQVVA